MVLEEAEGMGEGDGGISEVVFDIGAGAGIREGDDEEGSGEERQRVERAKMVAIVAQYAERRYMMQPLLAEYLREESSPRSLKASQVIMTPQGYKWTKVYLRPGG